MDRKETREWCKNIEYIIQALTKEWEHSGPNYRAYECSREDVSNIYEYFTYFMNVKQAEFDRNEGTFLTDMKNTKESYVLMRIMDKVNRKVNMASSKKNGTFVLMLDKEEDECIGFILEK